MGKKKRFNRFTAMSVIMIMVFCSIASRLYYLQVVKADEYKEKANKRAITEIQDPAPRGYIEDKNGIKLADNNQSYTLTFAETDESDLYFYKTMDQVFKILDNNKEVQKDDFELKANPFSFQFEVTDADAKKDREIRFKKDRGFYELTEHKMYPKLKDKPTDAQDEAITTKMLQITPKQVFDELVKDYGITPEDIFKMYVKAYKTTPDEALDLISSQYKVSSMDEVKNLLDQYKKEKKKDKADAILKSLEKLCGVDKIKFTVNQQRRYMIVKDAIKMQSFSGYKPVTIASNINKDTAFIIAQQLSNLPGIDISIQPIRVYPYDELGSAFLGYLSKIPTNSDKYEEEGYDVDSDLIGASGIEGVYEDRLKGSKGGRIVKLNKQGRVSEELGSRESYPGQTIQLTIDSNVQYAAETALDSVMKQLQAQGRVKDVDTSNATRGAAVAIDVHTGAVIALASRPGFDPNDFANPSGLSTDLYNKYFNPDYVAYGKSRNLSDDMINILFPVNPKTNLREDKYDYVPKPLYNYALNALTPPGSTFKPMTAVAGLETGVITPWTIVQDEGVFNDGNGFIDRFPSDGRNGPVNLTTALEKSSNPYFMTTGQKLRQSYGDDILAKYAWKFGLGADTNANEKPATGIELPESFGQVYYSGYAKKIIAQNYLGATIEDLKAGKSNKGSTFTSIDLFYKDSDSSELRSLKEQIKNMIQDSIKTGELNDKGFTDLITKIINTDPLYKGKDISKTEIATIVSAIESRAVYDGYYQIKGGFNMYNASIGQGFSNFTPLQLANYIATLVNGGTRYKVHLVDKILDADGNIIQQNKPEVIDKTGVSQSTLDAIKAGMHEVVGDGGTASGVFTNFPIDNAGKTGSATFQNNQDELGRTSYGVYVGFAPFNDPQIAVAVMVFDGGHGGYVAPVAKAMYEAYFKKELDALHYTPQFDTKAQPIKSK